MAAWTTVFLQTPLDRLTDAFPGSVVVEDPR